MGACQVFRTHNQFSKRLQVLAAHSEHFRFGQVAQAFINGCAELTIQTYLLVIQFVA